MWVNNILKRPYPKENQRQMSGSPFPRLCLRFLRAVSQKWSLGSLPEIGWCPPRAPYCGSAGRMLTEGDQCRAAPGADMITTKAINCLFNIISNQQNIFIRFKDESKLVTLMYLGTLMKFYSK